MKYTILLQINSLDQGLEAYNFIKKILDLSTNPEHITLYTLPAKQFSKKIIPLRWLYYSSSIDFFNLISDAIQNSDKYNYPSLVLYISIHYENIEGCDKKTIEKLRVQCVGI
jgi:hypothetical protein